MNGPPRARFARSLSCLGVALLLGCGPTYATIETCEEADGIRPICGMQNPEDMAPLADGRTLIVSQFGLMDGSRPGNLALLDAESGVWRVVFEGGGAADPANAEQADWGDADCPGPPPAAFSPHGLDLAPRPDGRLRLLVVNHGGREAIEFFEVFDAGSETRIVWRGCAVAPEHAYLNDVVSLPDGGLLTSHMMDRDGEASGLLRATLGFDTGFVYAWHPASDPAAGFAIEPGSAGPFPNGIELSADGRTIFLNLYSAGEVVRIDRETGQVTGRAEVPSPDNSSWGRDGRLLVASHVAGLRDQMACYGLASGACPMAFEIVAVDPASMQTETILRHAGPPFGGGTIAIDLGDRLVLGTFAGDRAAVASRDAVH